MPKGFFDILEALTRLRRSGTRIDYRVEIVPKLWMPETIAGPLLRTEVDRQFNAILKELIRRNTQ